MSYLYKSDGADLAQVAWHQYDIVVLGCSLFMGESCPVAERAVKGGMSVCPLVVMMLDELNANQSGSGSMPGHQYHSGSDLCFPVDVPVAEFMSGLDVMLEVRWLRYKYPLYLSGWRFREVLHNSENAVIFLAQNDQGEQVAVKRFKFNAAEISEQALSNFLTEVRILMEHHNEPVLARLLDAGVTEEGVVYLVMEYLPGMTLKERLTSAFGSRSMAQRLQWFRQIVRALAIIHESGLLHRDLKSSNILMREDDSPALLDLGVETHLLVESGFLREDEIYGTPFYISPERIIGEPASVQSDLYALGVLFYEILVGEKPVQGRDLGEILKGHMFGPAPQLPEKFAAYQPLLSKLLLKSPESRLNSARAALVMLDDLSS
ncbi:MAG: serine/threonine-protein kinase [Thiolinea sp.]